MSILHGNEEHAFAGVGYISIEKCDEVTNIAQFHTQLALDNLYLVRISYYNIRIGALTMERWAVKPLGKNQITNFRNHKAVQRPMIFNLAHFCALLELTNL